MLSPCTAAADADFFTLDIVIPVVRAINDAATNNTKKIPTNISGSNTNFDRENVYVMRTSWSCSGTMLCAVNVTTGRPPFSVESKYVYLHTQHTTHNTHHNT